MIILGTDNEAWGYGDNREEATQDAIANCCHPETGKAINREWIEQEIERGKDDPDGMYYKEVSDNDPARFAFLYFREFGRKQAVDNDWLGTAYSEAYQGDLDYDEFAAEVSEHYRALRTSR